MPLKYMTICEYGIIAVKNNKEKSDKVLFLDKDDFNDIKRFVLENKDNPINPDEFLIPGYNSYYGEILKAKNYVGVIQTRHGTVIEILPKIAKLENKEGDARQIFLKMLSTLRDSPFKNLGNANLKSYNNHLFEIFIKMFLDEVITLMKKGLKSDYIAVEENSTFLKGKLKTEKNILYNIIHKERFYIEYDEFVKNRPENRLIKTTVKYLSKLSVDFDNKKKIREILFTLDDIEESKSIDMDFASCKSNRLMKDYELILQWCRIFLKKESFSNFKGTTVAFALLFPMEKIFESYVTHIIKKQNILEDFHSQKFNYHFCENKNSKKKMFRMIPDITGIKDNHFFIIDAKWKLLNSNENNSFDITQSDFYQVFSYAKIYEKDNDYKYKVILIYPKNEIDKTHHFIFNDKNNINLKIGFIDLSQIVYKEFNPEKLINPEWFEFD